MGASNASGYDIDYSCRFDGSSGYLSKTLGTPTNNKKWTLSTWFKMGDLGQGQFLSAGGNQVFVLGAGEFEFAGARLWNSRADENQPSIS